ncbi:histidine kinase N-terminal 7TM domain-containing protein [Patescibacteria group bacterium]
MEIEIILASIVAVVDVILAIYLFLHKPRTVGKIAFGFVVLQIAIWGGTHVFGLLASAPDTLIYLTRASLIAVLFIPALVLFFALNFPQSQRLPWWLVVVIFLPPCLMLPFSFGALNAEGFVDNVPSYANAQTGALYYVFIPYFIIFFGISLYKLYRYLKDEDSVIIQLQIKYILWGLGLSAGFGIINNAIAPQWFQMYVNPIYGVVGSLFFTLAVAYAITRYRFFRMKFLITRGLIYGAILFFFYLLVMGLFILGRSVVPGDRLAYELLFAGFLTLLLLSFDRVRKVIQKSIKKVVPERGYDFSKIEEAPRVVDSEKYFYSLSEDVQASLSEVFEGVGTDLYIYLRPDEKWIPFDVEEGKPLLSDHIIPDVLKKLKEPVYRQEIKLGEQWVQGRMLNDELRRDLLKAIDGLQADIILPIWWYSEEIRGFIILRLPEKLDFISLEKVVELKKVSAVFNSWLTSVISYHYAVLRSERIYAGLNPNRE